MNYVTPYGAAPVATCSNQRGVTLIEAVLFIVISLSLIIGGIIFFQQANLSSRVNDTLRIVTGIQSETRGLFASQSTFGTGPADLDETLEQAGAVPSSVTTDTAGAFTNSWGGDINVQGEGALFSVTLSNIPKEACTRIAPVDANGTGSAGVGIVGVAVDNGTAVLDYGTTIAGAAATTGVLSAATPANMATACSDDTDADGVVDLTWIFTR